MSLPTFQRSVLPPSLGRSSTLRNNPEDTRLSSLEPIWTWRRREKRLPLLGTNTLSYCCQPEATLIDISLIINIRYNNNINNNKKSSSITVTKARVTDITTDLSKRCLKKYEARLTDRSSSHQEVRHADTRRVPNQANCGRSNSALLGASLSDLRERACFLGATASTGKSTR
jgi:hypothetical protein